MNATCSAHTSWGEPCDRLALEERNGRPYCANHAWVLDNPRTYPEGLD